MEKEKNINYEMCKKCQGVCCKQNGCVYKPTDFKSLDFESLKIELEKGKISISGQPIPLTKHAWTFLPYLRARNKNANTVDLITNGGPCINLTENGCTLSEEERPSYGLLAKPAKIGGPCRGFDSGDAINWLDYSDVLDKLIKYYTNKEMIDIIVEEISKQIIESKKKCQKKISLSMMEKENINWYYNIMGNKEYYTPSEVKKMILL